MASIRSANQYYIAVDSIPFRVTYRNFTSKNLSALYLKRNDTKCVDFYFCDGTGIISPPPGAYSFQAKVDGFYDSSPILTGYFTRNTDTAGFEYLQLCFNWSNANLENSFKYVSNHGICADVCNSFASKNEHSNLDLVGEIAWVDGGKKCSTSVFDVLIENSLTKSITDIPDVPVSPNTGADTLTNLQLVPHDGVVDATAGEKTVVIASGALSIEAHIANNTSDQAYQLSWSDSDNLNQFNVSDALKREYRGAISPSQILTWPETTIVFPLGSKGTYAVSGLENYPPPVISS